MRLFLMLVLLSANVLAQNINSIKRAPTQVRLEYTWLTVANFQKLTRNEQNAIIAAIRDTVVLALHAMSQHKLETCISKITPEELKSIKNTALEIKSADPRYVNSVTTGVATMAMQLCQISPSENTPKKKEPTQKSKKST